SHEMHGGEGGAELCRPLIEVAPIRIGFQPDEIMDGLEQSIVGNGPYDFRAQLLVDRPILELGARFAEVALEQFVEICVIIHAHFPLLERAGRGPRNSAADTPRWRLLRL